MLIVIGIVTKGLMQTAGGRRNKRTSRDHPSYSFIKNGQDTEKSPGDLRKLAVTQAPVRKHRCEKLSK